MRVPRELDELMWAVAEQRNPETNEQFLERYPEFAGELEHRVQIVNSLRGSRPSRSVERFVPRETVRSFGPSRLAVAGVALLVLGSVTFAAYATMQYVNSKRSSPESVRQLPEIIFNPPKLPVPDSTTTGGGTETTETEQMASMGVPPVQEDSFDAFKGRITIESDDIQLGQAITQITEQAGLRAVLAPGFEDKRIRIRYVNQPAIDVLKALGQMFGFTPVEQGKVEVLIIPTDDPTAADGPAIPGSVGVAASGGDKLPGNATTGQGGGDAPDKATSSGSDPG